MFDNKREIENIQDEELKILKSFKEYCLKHNLKYALEGGTLLGAVRHKGFIPWDDDIDVIMPRQDYEKLLALTKQEPVGKSLYIVNRESGHGFQMPYTKICNQDTVVYENGELQNTGVFIDVFPMDGAPNRTFCISVRYKLMDRIKTWWNYSMMSAETVGSFSVLKKMKWRISCLFGEEFFYRVLDRIYRRYECGQTKYVSQITWSTIMVNDYTEEYLTQTELEFEGDMYTVPSCYHKRLTTMYGDYMQLPPEEQRKAKHTIKAYWKN